MKLLSLDLSTSCSGWSVFQDGKLVEHGSVKEGKYKGKSLQRYPQRTGRVSKMMCEELLQIIIKVNPDKIVIEEAAANGIAGVKSIKSLCMAHGQLLLLILQAELPVYDSITFLSPREWRGAVGLKKNGDFKASSVQSANKLFGLNLDLTQHDISDSILLGQGYLKLGGYLEKKV